MVSSRGSRADEDGPKLFDSVDDLKRIIDICSTSNAYIGVITTGHLAGNGQLFVRNEAGGEFQSAALVSLDLMRHIVRHQRFYRDTAHPNRWRLRPPM